ncbi:MAG: DUF5664 domain-containing protein [Candidatus Moranbacteria bacterium]|nr:DUF5664 domain-containing protein [Candidatus Moranbacteria bacterium]
MNEIDPHGKAPGDPGAKLDSGKNRLGLVLGDFARALEEVGRVGTFGAAKYSPRGWVEVPNGIDRYHDALYRHLLSYAKDDLRDKDSGLLHLSHACWNSLALLDLTLRNRPEQPKAAEPTDWSAS